MTAPWDLYPESRTLADIALALVAVVLMPATSVLRGRRLGVERPASMAGVYSATIARGLVITAAVAGVWWFYSRDPRALGLDWPVGIGGWIGLGAAAVIAVVGAAAVIALGSAARGRLEQSLKQIDSLKIMPRSRSEYVLFLLVSLSAGIWEELLYRGFLIWFFAPWLGAPGSAALAAIIFGLGHAYQGTSGILRTGLLGAAFAVGYLLTESLWWLIAIHAFVDIFGGTVTMRVRALARRDGLL